MKLFKKMCFLFIITLVLIIITACGDKKEIVVKFDTQGGSQIEDIILEKDDSGDFKLPDNPKKDGYRFDGWYSDINFQNEFKSLDSNSEEVTLYAKWVSDRAEPQTGVSFKLTTRNDIEVRSTLINEKESTEDNLVYDDNGHDITANVSIEGFITAKSLTSLNDISGNIDISLVFLDEHNQEEISIPDATFKISIKNGVIYLLVPSMFSTYVGNTSVGISIDVNKIYQEFTKIIKTKLKELINELKNLPVEDLPEGFDFSILDQIDLNNFNIDDIIALKELLPDEMKEKLNDIEDLETDALVGLAEIILEPFLGDNYSEEVFNTIRSYLTSLVEIFTEIIPNRIEENGKVSYEITQEQLIDLIEEFALLTKENIDEIYELIIEVKDLVDEKEEEFVSKEYITRIIDSIISGVESGLSIPRAIVSIKLLSGTIPSKIEGGIEASLDLNSDIAPAFLVANESIAFNLSTNIDSEFSVVVTTIDFPDFSTYFDLTGLINNKIKELLSKEKE